MRIVVTGATGNAGTSVLAALAADPRVTEIVGLARRRPAVERPKTRWVAADVATDPLEEPLPRAPTPSIHLAWLIQPSRDERALEAVNVHGSRRVFEAAARRRRSGARPRLLRRRLLRRPRRSRGRRELADRRHAELVLRAPQGRRRAGARRGRGGASGAARRPPAPGADLQARRRLGHPAAVRRPAAALAARRPASSLPVLPAAARPAAAGRARRRRGGGLPARLSPRGQRRGRLQRRRGARARHGDARPAARRARRRGPGRAGPRRRRALLAARLQPTPPAGSTWASPCR